MSIGCINYMINTIVADALCGFADRLEGACMKTLNDGIMTKDLVGLVTPGIEVKAVNSAEFIEAIRMRM